MLDQKYTVLYCRVSSDEQSSDNKVSLPDQERKLAEYAKRHGLNNLKVLREDCSGFKYDRPELNRVRELIEHDQVKAVLFVRIDRIAREQAILDQLRKDYFIPHSVDVYSIEDMGLLRWDMYSIHMQDNMVNFANLWGKILVKVMQDGLRARVRKGSVICYGRPPYGYRVIRNEQTDLFELAIDEVEADWIRKIFNWYVYEGLGGDKIRSRLNELRVPTPGSASHRWTNSGWWMDGWSARTVLGILKNETYVGKWHYGKRSKNPETKALPTVEVPSIIDEQLFRQAQEQRKHNGRHLRKMGKHEYLVSGHVRCAHCGRALNGHPTTRRYKNKTYFYLWYRHAYEKRPCKMSFRADGKNGVDTAVWEYIEAVMRDRDLLWRSVEKYMADEQARLGAVTDRLQSIENSIREKERELSRLTDAYQAGVLELDVFAARKQVIDDSIASYRRQKSELSETTKELDRVNEITTIVEEALDELDYLDFKGKRKIIRGLNTEVTLEKLGNKQNKVHISCILGSHSCLLGSEQSCKDLARNYAPCENERA